MTSTRRRASRPPTFAEVRASVLAADLEHRRQLERRNSDRMRRVAAGLPACVIPSGHCPVHNDSEVGTRCRGADLVTTSTTGPRLNGCC